MENNCLPSDKNDFSGQSDSGISSEGEVGIILVMGCGGVNYTMQIWIDVVQYIACSTTEIDIWVPAMAWAFCCTRRGDFVVFISPLRLINGNHKNIISR